MAKPKYRVVKFFSDDDGDKLSKDKWHYVWSDGTGDRKLCTQEFFGLGESDADYMEKQGLVTCPICIAIIKHFKSLVV